MIGVATGWLASHLTRKAGLLQLNSNSEPHVYELRFLSATMSRQLLDDVFILIDNLCGLIKQRRNTRFVLAVIFFISSSGYFIESGIKKLKNMYPTLFIPSADTVLRTLHALSPEEVDRAILRMLRVIFDVAAKHRSKKDIKSILKHVWLAVDITDVAYYGKMGSQKKTHPYKKAVRFIERSHRYIHNTKDGRALKYLTVSIARGPMSGLIVYVAPLKAGYSLNTEVDRALRFLEAIMDIDLVLMDRGFYSGSVYEVLRAHNIRFLTPAVKSKGVKEALFESLKPERIAAEFSCLISEAIVFLDMKFHGRGYKGTRQFKALVSNTIGSIGRATSIAEIIEYLKRLVEFEGKAPEKLKTRYKCIRDTAENIIKEITMPPRYIVQEFKLGGKVRSRIVLSMQLDDDAFQNALRRSFICRRNRNVQNWDEAAFLEALRHLFLDSYYFFATPVYKQIDVTRQGEFYKRRWTVETAHRMFHEVMLHTTSNDISVRNMELLVAIALYDLWVIHRKRSGGVEEEHVYKESLREFKENFTRNEFLQLEYEEGHVFFVRYGEIVDSDAYIRGISDMIDRYMRGYMDESRSIRTLDSGEPPPHGVQVYVIMAVCTGGDCRA